MMMDSPQLAQRNFGGNWVSFVLLANNQKNIFNSFNFSIGKPLQERHLEIRVMWSITKTVYFFLKKKNKNIFMNRI